MIIVSDTSPLTNLAAIEQFHLLQELYQHIFIPDSVWSELNANGIQWPGSQQTRRAPWIERVSVANRALVTALRRDLDQGEAEAIALALELPVFTSASVSIRWRFVSLRKITLDALRDISHRELIEILLRLV